MKVLNVMIVALLAVMTCSFVFAAPKMTEYFPYESDAPVNVVFQSVVPYKDLAPTHQQMVNKYKQAFLALPGSKMENVRVVRSGIAPEAEGTTPIYFQTKDKYGLCGIVILDVKKSGNYTQYYSPCP